MEASAVVPASLTNVEDRAATLREVAYTWLRYIQTRRADFINAPIPDVHPHYPLPPGFPYGSFVLEQHFRWFDPEDPRIVYEYPLRVRFHGVPARNKWHPLLWTVESGFLDKKSVLGDETGLILIGLLYLDARMFRDEINLPMRLTPDLIHEFLVLAAGLGKRLYFGSRIEAPEANRTHSNARRMNVEMFELRTSDGVMLRQYAGRYVHKRACGGCTIWLPPMGPSMCNKCMGNPDA